MKSHLTVSKISKIIITLNLLITLSGCASLVTQPYSQYYAADKAELRVVSGSLKVSPLQTYVIPEDCTDRRRMDGVGGKFRSPTDTHYLPPNEPFVMSVYAGRGSDLCIYSLSFIPEPTKKYELNVEIDSKNYCLSSFTKNELNSPILVANSLPAGVVESSPFCKGHTFREFKTGVFETTAYRQDGFATIPLTRQYSPKTK